jgi:transcriptional regulator with XRE-family HTH domain
MTMNDLVSRNIRRFRSERELSLGELAQRAALSKQTLSKIEQGVGNPTVGTLESIANALGVSIRRLVTEWGTRGYVSRASEAAWKPSAVGEERSLDRIYGSGYVQTQIIVVDVENEARTIPAHSSGTLHQLYVIEGKLQVGPQNEEVCISAGDFLRFPGDVDHSYRSLGGRATAHVTTTAPQVPQFSPALDESRDRWGA